ncbi:MAG: type I-B CRISPR-associated endonuclease Cas1, partial [Alphaproteobacteria bacterium]|nr:type I-B CRISPR-associated endonuclease Cas1 [Alphaproteobacteria bacterium]
MITLSEIFTEAAIQEVLDEFEKKKDSCGVDGMYLSELREYWSINRDRILESILQEQFVPGIVRNIEIVNYKGKKRIVSLYNSIDRLVLRVLTKAIQI